MKKILITAFEPFGGSAVNTSAAVLEKLPEEIGGAGVEKALLPVVFGKAAEKALTCKADCIFLLGEAGGRTAVTPERRGRNRKPSPHTRESPRKVRSAVPSVRRRPRIPF